MISPRSHMFANFLFFQTAWFITAVFAGKGLGQFGILASVLVIMIHLLFAAKSATVFDPLMREIELISLVSLIGFTWETTLFNLDLLQYKNHDLANSFPPIWLLLLWPLFATSLNVTLRWLHGRYLTASILGAVFGPLSFLAGQKLGAVKLMEPSLTLCVLAAGWACLVPLAIKLSEIFDGFRQSPPKESINLGDPGRATKGAKYG